MLFGSTIRFVTHDACTCIRTRLHTQGDKTETEHKFSYTQIYKQFVTDFEKRLEDFIKKKGSTPEKFAELCRIAIDEAEDENVQEFIDVLCQATDYQTFIDMARDKEKRAYFLKIITAYGKQLSDAAKDAAKS